MSGLVPGELALYSRLLDEYLLTHRGAGLCSWRVGALLRFVRDSRAYEAHGYASFEQWLRERRGIQVKQADRYIKIARLPEDLLDGVEADVHRLAAVSDKDPRFWPPLITAADEGIAEVKLNAAARAGKLHLRQHGDLDAAQAGADAGAEEGRRDRGRQAPTGRRGREPGRHPGARPTSLRCLPSGCWGAGSGPQGRRGRQPRFSNRI